MYYTEFKEKPKKSLIDRIKLFLRPMLTLALDATTTREEKQRRQLVSIIKGLMNVGNFVEAREYLEMYAKLYGDNGEYVRLSTTIALLE